MELVTKSPEGDLLEVCQAWQKLISQHEGNPAAQRVVGHTAIEELRDFEDFRGTRKVIVKSDAALMLEDGLSQEEVVWPFLSFGELIVSGELGKVSYITLNQNALLTWMLINAQVINTEAVDLEVTDPVDDELEFAYYLPVERPVTRPLYVPVGLVQYALCAA